MVLASYGISPKVSAILGFGIGLKTKIEVLVVHYFIVNASLFIFKKTGMANVLHRYRTLPVRTY